MTRCRIPEFSERYQIDIGIFDPKGKRIFSRNVKQRDMCVFVQKITIVSFGKMRRDSSLNGVEEIDKNFNYGKYKINEKILKQ